MVFAALPFGDCISLGLPFYILFPPRGREWCTAVTMLTICIPIGIIRTI
uniref:Uncharacterized protein n=1 Tax=Arundo donax TaxID=35708 RepID=A0A0A9BPC5_ARUDO